MPSTFTSDEMSTIEIHFSKIIVLFKDYNWQGKD